MSKDRERKRLPVQKHCLIVIIIITHCCHGNRVEWAGIAISSHCHPAPNESRSCWKLLAVGIPSKPQCQRRDSEWKIISSPENQVISECLRSTEKMKSQRGDREWEKSAVIIWQDRRLIPKFLYMFYLLVAAQSYFFHNPFTWLVDLFFFFTVESQKQLGEQLGGEEKRENLVVLTFLLDSVSLFTMTSRWNLLTLGE